MVNIKNRSFDRNISNIVGKIDTQRHIHELQRSVKAVKDALANIDNVVTNTTTVIETIQATTRAIGITIDGGGAVITTGIKGYIEVPFSGLITGWTILADVVGSIVVDVWKDTLANYPPTVADTIAGTEKPTLSADNANQDLDLITWSGNVTEGDIIAFNVDSVATVTRVTVLLRILPA